MSSSLSFLIPPSTELGVGDWQTIGTLEEGLAHALWLCQNNGPIPGERLRVGLTLLLTIPLEQLKDGEVPPYWALVGILEWISENLLQGHTTDHVRQVISDLWILCPMENSARTGLIDRVTNRFPGLLIPSVILREHI